MSRLEPLNIVDTRLTSLLGMYQYRPADLEYLSKLALIDDVIFNYQERIDELERELDIKKGNSHEQTTP